PGRTIACAARSTGDVAATQARFTVDGIEAGVTTPRGPLAVRSPLLAEHNLENIVVAIGVGEALELPPRAMVEGIAALRGVPGRVERVASGEGEFLVLVDYAHTPDALERALAAVRPLVRGRLLVVFGCGGDRDPGKRPLMGRIGVRDSDFAILTSD